jgi:predicted transposase YbfD/YdcC
LFLVGQDIHGGATAARQVLGIQTLADKSNDRGHPETLGAVGLDVTIDAMGCQESVTQDIMRSRTGHVLALKGNRSSGVPEFRTSDDFRTSRTSGDSILNS